MTTFDFELNLYRHLSAIATHLEQARDATGALRYCLHATQGFFGATEACLATLEPGRDLVTLEFAVPHGSEWDLRLLTGFLRGDRVEIAPNVLLGKLLRRDRLWGVIGLRRGDGQFEKAARKAVARVAGEISDGIQRIDRERLLEVRAWIDGKVMQQLRPQDLSYLILDGLRSLTGYDHSSALLIYDPQAARLRLVAEQIAWLKRKSRKIGLELPLSQELMKLIQGDAVYGSDRRDDHWEDWPGQQATGLAELLDYNDDPGHPAPEPREGTILCAPLMARDGLLGLLKVASLHAGTFGSYEAALIRGFMPVASIAVQNSQKTQTLQARMLQAERKHAIVDLARGVSHDINNALGSILPLVQQMHEDVRAGRVDPATFEKDLGDIEQSLQVCRRIFGGMLNFARSSARSDGHGDVRRAVECTRSVLGDSLERQGIRLDSDVPDALPPIKGSQGDLEQLLLNLVTNARDAMPGGGVMAVHALQASDHIEMTISDTGCGIPPDHMSKIQEPFFTTKPHGTGLGLSTCRWIVWEMRGEISIESKVGQGTRVKLHLPVYTSGKRQA